ncbi:unnamed protein product [Blepharisma stoltei]|uniref:GTP-binding protein n=1 Tax=Blepharisma stoltei TaxID=1481888 RepID=A0AAU9KBG5_9CILI|nr:unnamed protein product [Blepharisma stoltei]
MNIAVLGSKRVGKSSILKVVFQKMSPNETLFIESTTRVDEVKIQNNPYTRCTILDFPGTFEISQMTSLERRFLQDSAMIIYVLDAQDEPYNKSLEKLVSLMSEVYSFNPHCKIEVFCHKIDGDMFVNDDVKLGVLNEVSEIVRFDTTERKLPEPSFHLTSIYDLSIFEAMSKCIQKITPGVGHMQNLLDILMSHCRIDKVYVFDVISKLYIATDSTPVDLISYELCSDMIDVVIDVSCIYGVGEDENFNNAFDGKSTSVIRLDTGLTLYLREVEHLLALVCLVKDDNFERHHLIDYNIDRFKEGAKKILDAREKWVKEQEEVKG